MFFFLLLFLFTDQIFVSWRQAAFILVVTMDRLVKDPRHRESIIKQYIAGGITRRQASVRLGVSVAYVSTLKRRYLKEGKDAFRHGNTGRTNSRKVDEVIETRVVDLYRSLSPAEFNFTHFCQYTRADGSLYRATDGMEISDKTIIRILGRHGLRSPSSHRNKGKKHIHPLRPRRLCLGELVQLDACIDYFTLSSTKLALHVAIDDATSLIVGAHFDYQETTESYFHVLKDIIDHYGIPGAFYTDNRTSFISSRDSKPKQDSRVQFRRACQTLGIELITTSTAQAKGRVERFMRTAQDRLSNELKANGICSIDQANDYLKQVFIPSHNQRYGAPPGSSQSVFSELEPQLKQNLDYILALHHTRTILNGNVISYHGKQYLPIKTNGEIYLLPSGVKVKVIATYDQQPIAILHQGKYYRLKHISSNKHYAVPGSNHPWRRFIYGSKKRV